MRTTAMATAVRQGWLVQSPASVNCICIESESDQGIIPPDSYRRRWQQLGETLGIGGCGNDLLRN